MLDSFLLTSCSGLIVWAYYRSISLYIKLLWLYRRYLAFWRWADLIWRLGLLYDYYWGRPSIPITFNLGVWNSLLWLFLFNYGLPCAWIFGKSKLEKVNVWLTGDGSTLLREPMLIGGFFLFNGILILFDV